MLWGIYSAIYDEVNVSVEECVEIMGDYVEKQQSCFISDTLKSWSGRKLLDPTTYVYCKTIYCGTVEWYFRVSSLKMAIMPKHVVAK